MAGAGLAICYIRIEPALTEINGRFRAIPTPASTKPFDVVLASASHPLRNVGMRTARQDRRSRRRRRALPAALRQIGLDVRVLLPGVPAVLAALAGARDAGRIDAVARLPAARLLEAELPAGVPAWVIDCPQLYDRAGGPYQDTAGVDWEDNPLRFGLLVAHRGSARRAEESGRLACADRACERLANRTLRRHTLHSPTKAQRPASSPIHNLAFQGIFAPHWVADLGLPAASFAVDGVEYHGRFSFLKAGLFTRTRSRR